MRNIELLKQWRELALPKKMSPAIECRTVLDEFGEVTHWAECANGRHWSKESQEDALEELIDAHTEGVEDREETRLRIMKMGVSAEQANALAQKIAADIKVANKKMPRADRDMLVLAQIAEIELQYESEMAAKEAARKAAEAKQEAARKELATKEAEAAAAAKDEAEERARKEAERDAIIASMAAEIAALKKQKP